MGSLASAQAARQHPHKRLLRGTARAPSRARDGVGELPTPLPRARPERRRCRRVSACASPSSASAPGPLATNAAARKVSRAGQAGVARVGGQRGPRMRPEPDSGRPRRQLGHPGPRQPHAQQPAPRLPSPDASRRSQMPLRVQNAPPGAPPTGVDSRAQSQMTRATAGAQPRQWHGGAGRHLPELLPKRAAARRTDGAANLPHAREPRGRRQQQQPAEAPRGA